jgi:hypothetical protein
MPALKDLFRTQPLPTKNNKVGAEVYAVRNSKDIPISTANGLLNATVFPIVQKTLRSSGLLTARTKENLVESELVGLRAIRGLASPVIYGTSLIRFKRKTTNAVEVMKNATNGGSEGSNFVLGSTVAKLQDKALELASRIGIEFPENLIPTKVSEKPAFAKKKVKDTMKILKELKDGSAGTLLGRFVAESAQGTPNQIGRQVLGTAISLARDEIRRSLTSSFTLPTVPSIGNIGNPVVEQTIRLRNYTPKPYDNGRDKYTQKVSRRGNIAFDGLSGILTGIQLQRTAYSDWASQKIQYDASNFANPDFDNRVTFKRNNDGALGVNVAGIAGGLTPVPLPPPITQNIPASPTALQRRANKYSSGIRVRANGIEKLGIRNGSDKLNDAATWYSTTGNPPPGADGKSLDDFDLVPFRFWSISKKTGVSFRATITGLSESITPSWNASKFIGNPYNFYTYEGVERSVSFSFKMYSLNKDELKRMWEKLSFLNTFAYPQQYAVPHVTPPFLKFTLGNMYKNKEGFVESLAFSIDDNTMWEVGKTHISENGLPVLDNTLKDYKLPTVIDVQMTIKFVESQSTFWDGNTPKRVYYYGGVDQSKSTLSEIGGNMLPDGSTPFGLSETTLPEVEVTATRLPSYGSDRDITKVVDKELLGNADANARAGFLANMSGLKATQELNNQAAANAAGNVSKKIFRR